MTDLQWKRSLPRIIFTIAAVLFGNVAARTGVVFGQVSLPVPQATPAALIESIVIQNREVTETDELRPQATVTRGSETVRIVLPFFLYKGDAIETLADTKVTVLFLDDPVPERRNKIIIYPGAKVSIGSSDSWWGRVWAKVKGGFSSRTRYARLAAPGTEYELNVIQDEDRAILTVIEGTVEVFEGEVDIGAASPYPKQNLALANVRMAPPQFVLASYLTPAPQSQFGRVVQVPAGQTTSLTITYNVQSDCLQPHLFQFRTSERTDWFSVVGDKNFRIQGPRGTASETRQILIDATRLAPGTYDAHVYVVCPDCANEAGCRREQLEWVYRITVVPPDVPPPTPTPTATPNPTPTDQTFSVSEKEQVPIGKPMDQVVGASDSDVRFILNWTGAVLIATQPIYSAQNLIPHFNSVAARNSTFTSARERAALSNDATAYAQLGNVYNDWGQGAWASFAHEKQNNRAPTAPATATKIDLAEAYRQSGRLREAEQQGASFTTDLSAKARNFFGNLALDRARIALDAGKLQEAEARVADAKRQYAAALAVQAGQPSAGGDANRTVNANVAEANIVAGEAALERNAAAEAKRMFEEAARAVELLQQASSINPFPVTNLGIAYRGQGDAAILSGDLAAAKTAYTSAKRQHEQAIAAHSDFAEAYFNLGDLYDNLGDSPNAKANYFLAIKHRPEQPAAYYPLAMLVKDEDPALAAALAATFLKLEREPFRHGRAAENARKLADRRPVIRPPRIGERLGAVPNLIGRTQSEATSAITAAGFKVGRIESRRMTGAANVVREQTPAAGANPAAGSAIDLVISTGDGDVTLPNVVGRQQSQARAELEGLGLVVSAQIKPDTRQPKDRVSEQNPSYRPNRTVRAGSTVKLTVSAGDLVEIPDVVGKELDDAKKKIISGNKLRVGSIDSRQDCKVDRVIEQSPPRSNQKIVERGTAINLVVGVLGDNPVTIPKFTDRQSAEQFVNDNGLKLKPIRSVESESPEGSVLEQSPKAGRQFGRNCPVEVELAVAIPIVWVDIEDYSGQPVAAVQQKLRALEVNAIVQSQEYSDAQPGTVFQQSPAGPTRVKHWSYVILVVAKKPPELPVNVPNLCKMDKTKAQELLDSMGLTSTIEKFETLPPNAVKCGAGGDTVTWQDPKPNTPLQKGKPVKLWLVPIE